MTPCPMASILKMASITAKSHKSPLLEYEDAKQEAAIIGWKLKDRPCQLIKSAMHNRLKNLLRHCRQGTRMIQEGLDQVENIPDISRIKGVDSRVALETTLETLENRPKMAVLAVLRGDGVVRASRTYGLSKSRTYSILDALASKL